MGYTQNNFKNIFSGPFGTLWLLVSINVAIFVLLGLIHLLSGSEPWYLLALASPLSRAFVHPWGLITYMVVQVDFINLLFNMLWLWAFGAILLRFGRKSDLWISYILGGLTGGFFFLFTAQLSESPNYLIGASAAVLSVITATGALYPRIELNLMLFGSVRLIWIAIGAIIICGIAPGVGNTPTLLAHVGGIAGGLLSAFLSLCAISAKRKNFSKKPWRNVRIQERRGLNAAEQRELDALLDRVKTSGYKSLSMKERSRLFEISNKINH